MAGNDRGRGGDCAGTTEEEEEGGTPRVLRSGTSPNGRGGEGDEDEGELCQSVSAPHLGGDSEEEEEEGGRADTTSRTDKVTPNVSVTANYSSKQESPIQDVSTGKRVMFDRQRGTPGNSGGNDGHKTVERTESTPAGRNRKMTHRRSRSLSVVELGLPQLEPNSPGAPSVEGGDRERGMKRNQGAATLKPSRSPLLESTQSSDQHSSASASRSNSIKDNRSRASSLLTDASSLHESEDLTSEEEDTMPELSGLSGASLDEQTGSAATSVTPVANEAEQERLKPSRDSPDRGRVGDVVLRVRNGRSRVSQEARYSADVLTSYKNELEANPVLSGPGSRRLNSESINEMKGARGEQSADDAGSTLEKGGSIANDSVFDHEVALSDVDVRVQSDDGFSQGKPSPSPSPSPHRDSKKKIQRSPFLGRRPHTMREKTPPTPKNKLTRGLTKEEVTPLVGKMRSILSIEVGGDAPPEEPRPDPDANSPGGGSTSLDRLPRPPASNKTNGTTPFSRTTQQATPTSPPTSPARQLSSPPAVSFRTSSTAPNDQGPIPKSSSDKTLSGARPPLHKHSAKKPKTKTMSLDGSSQVVRDIQSMRNAVAEPLPEEALEEEEDIRPGKKDTSKVKMIRDNIIRRSKSRMKALTILGGGPDVEKAISECYYKGSGGTGAIRAKSAKQRPKLNDLFIPPEPPTSGSPQHQSREKEEGEEEEEEGKKEKKRDRKKLGPEHRRDSDSSLIHSPTNSAFDHSLSVVGESGQKVAGCTDPNSLSPAPPENLSDSDREEVSQQLVRSMSQSHPELEVREDTEWQRTVDRRVLRKMNKHERDRQNIIHELIQTERHHYRALHVLKLVFKSQMEKHLSEESLSIMFPELDNLIEISWSFLDRLEERRGKEGSNVIVQDISDILLEEFTTEKRERILNTFGEFCTYHLIAVEMYKEQLKKKQFGRLVQQLYRVKECQRLYLPDYYTSVSQRLTKMVQFLVRLVKKTDVLKLDHSERLRQCQRELESLVAAVDQRVNERKNQMELMEIQEKLEIGLPRTAAKHPVLRAMKDLNLTAQNRLLIKRGEAQLIHGHGKQLRKSATFTMPSLECVPNDVHTCAVVVLFTDVYSLFLLGNIGQFLVMVDSTLA